LQKKIGVKKFFHIL